eukprot:67783_1
MVHLLCFVGLILVSIKADNECVDATPECAASNQFSYGMYINPNITITEQQKQFYQENGFLVIPNALNADQLEIWRDLVDNSVASRGIDHIFPQKGQMDTVNPDFNYHQNVFTQRLNLWQNDEEMCKLVGSAGYTIGRIVSELEGIDGVQLHHDQALYKPAFGNPTSFHLDTPYWTFDSLHSTSCWVALDNVTKQNGCLYYISGSHKSIQSKDNPYKLIKIGKNMNEFFDHYPEFKDDKYECIAAEMNAGDMAIHNGLIVHAAGPNFTQRRRRAMTLGMFPVGSVFNGQKNILTDKQFDSMKVGELLNDINQNPVLYSKQKPADNHKCFF